MEKEFSIEQVEQHATSRRSDELTKYLAPFLKSDPHADALAMMGLCCDRGHGVSRDHEEAMRHYQESAEKGSMYGQFHYGWHLLATPKACSEEEDCSKGLEWLEKAAQNGSAPAQYELGLYYWELDRKEEAEAYFKKAAEAGHLWAHRYVGMLHRARCLQCLRLGLVSLQKSEEVSDTERCVTERSSESNEAIENAGHVFTDAFRWIGEINTKDDAILQCICADIYRHYGSKDDETLKWYKKAGAHSRFDSKYEPWSFDPNKRKRPSVDIPETFCWLSPARWERMVCQEAVQLRKSILYARVKVAELLQEQDPRRALSWWEKVQKLESNHVEANLHIGESYYHGWGCAPNYKLALAAFQSVLKEKPDHDKASLYVALCYHRGLDVEQNYEEAFPHFARAAEAATREGYLARYYTALCYYDGKGTNVDRAKAIEMMEAAAGIRLTEGGTEGDAPQGDTAPCTVDPDRLCGLACFFLGYLYEVGRDVSPDTDKAYELYRRGLKSKDPLVEMLEARDGLIDPSEEERSLGSDIERLSKEKDREDEYDKLQKELEKVVQDQEKISKACEGLSTKLHSFNTRRKQVDETTKAVTVQARSDIPYGTPDDGDSLPLRMGSVIEQERKKLVEFFNGKTAGIGWNQLDSYTRDSLLSACTFLAVSGEKDELDHSGACISASSALENELKLRFVDGYQRYLEDHVPMDRWPPFMQVCRDGDSAIVTREWLSLNDTKKLYETQDDQKALKDYLRTIKRNEGYQDEVIFKSVLDILGKCSGEELVRIRNGAGHTRSTSFLAAKKQTETVRNLIKKLMILTSIPGRS